MSKGEVASYELATTSMEELQVANSQQLREVATTPLMLVEL